MLTVSAFLATMFFLLWNIFLIGGNQSTIEFYSNYFGHHKGLSKPYSVTLQGNIDTVFGANSTWWSILLPTFAPPAGDGIVYPLEQG